MENSPPARTSALPELHQAEEAFKNVVWQPLEKLGEAAFFAKFPFLNWWPLNGLLKFFFEKKADETYDYAAMVLNVLYCPMKNASTQRIAAGAMLEEQAALDQFGPGSKEYADAREKGQKAFADHVRSLLVPGAS